MNPCLGFWRKRKAMKVLLSIKPRYATQIFDGHKRYEYRRSLFKKDGIKQVVVYASSPIGKVIGEFEIIQIIHKSIEKLWEETKSFSGISQETFFNYFQNKNKGYAIEIGTVKKYKKPISLNEHYGIKPPQSFVYLQE